MIYTTELEHHGTLGQKWGIRRYQNEDGSLTDAGRARYRQTAVGTDRKGRTKYKYTKLTNKNATAEELEYRNKRFALEKQMYETDDEINEYRKAITQKASASVKNVADIAKKHQVWNKKDLEIEKEKSKAKKEELKKKQEEKAYKKFKKDLKKEMEDALKEENLFSKNEKSGLLENLKKRKENYKILDEYASTAYKYEIGDINAILNGNSKNKNNQNESNKNDSNKNNQQNNNQQNNNQQNNNQQNNNQQNNKNDKKNTIEYVPPGLARNIETVADVLNSIAELTSAAYYIKESKELKD